MKTFLMITLTFSLLLASACTSRQITPCTYDMINPDSCEFGTYSTTENGCSVTKCRPSADFTCKDMKEGDSYFDKCNTCTCLKEGDACTKRYCPVLKKEGEMCGGIAGFQCEEGLTCELEGDYPDASGTCIKEDTTDLKEPVIDYSCTKDSDCVVKNVGNCCGYYPKCVNMDSETNPELVKQLCEEKGISSICGFPDIESCSCIDGTCTSN